MFLRVIYIRLMDIIVCNPIVLVLSDVVLIYPLIRADD